MPQCKTCELEKSEDHFRVGTDGKYSWLERRCKQCNTKARLLWDQQNPEKAKSGKRRYRARHLDKLNEYDRKRDRDPVRLAKINASTKAREQTPEGKRAKLESIRRWRETNPEKYRAQTAVGNAIRDGKLQRGSCASCGATKRVIGHHHDYSKPLDVIWLCPACHGAEHRELRWGIAA